LNIYKINKLKYFLKIGNIILILLALHRFQNEFGHHASGETLPTAHSVQKEQTFL
jgi:hypothetical protein